MPPLHLNVDHITLFQLSKKLLKKLKINKAASPDDLPAYILKELADKIIPILKAIYTQLYKIAHYHLKIGLKHV